jgi:hypothetical protein
MRVAKLLGLYIRLRFAPPSAVLAPGLHSSAALRPQCSAREYKKPEKRKPRSCNNLNRGWRAQEP